MKKVNVRVSMALLFSALLTMDNVMPTANAMPANDRIFKIVQPNGTTVEAKKRGDEHGGWIETKSGYSIAKSTNGYWYYVSQYNQTTPVLSATKASLTPPKGLVQHKVPVIATTESEPFDDDKLRKGKLSPKVLIILVDYAEWPGTSDASLFSKKIVNTEPNAKTITDYYAKASYGAVNITPATESHGVANDGVVGWLRLASDAKFGRSLGETEKWWVIMEAVAAADDYVDYADYDTNNDGKITGDELAIIVIRSGYEDATLGDNNPAAPIVWGQVFTEDTIGFEFNAEEGIKANYTKGFVTVCDTLDASNLDPDKGYTGPQDICHQELQVTDKEVTLFDPLIVGEIHQTDAGDKVASLGVFAHELGHSIFRLPDLYNRDPGIIGDIGGYSLMASGEWGMDYRTDTYYGETPVLPDAWTQYKLKWVGTTVLGPLESTGRNSIPSIKPKVGIAHIGKNMGPNSLWDCSNKEEYFLLQYRADVGYDRGLSLWFKESDDSQYAFTPGIAIFHVDESFNNNQGTPKLVDLEEANNVEVGTYWGEYYHRHLWYQGNADQFDSLSLPSSKANDGLESGVSISVLDQFVQFPYSSSVIGQVLDLRTLLVNVDIDSHCDGAVIDGHNQF